MWQGRPGEQFVLAITGMPVARRSRRGTSRRITSGFTCFAATSSGTGSFPFELLKAIGRDSSGYTVER